MPAPAPLAAPEHPTGCIAVPWACQAALVPGVLPHAPHWGGFLSGSVGVIIAPTAAITSLLAVEQCQPVQAQAWLSAITTLDKSCSVSSPGCPQLCHPPRGPRRPPLCQVTPACDRVCQGCAWDRQPHCSGCLAQRGAAPRSGPPHIPGALRGCTPRGGSRAHALQNCTLRPSTRHGCVPPWVPHARRQAGTQGRDSRQVPT